MARGELARKFFFGDSNQYLITDAERNFFYGIPQSQKQIVSLAKAQLASQRATAKAIVQSNSYAAQEINQLNRSMEASISSILHLGMNTAAAIEQLEDSLVCEFREAKWLLAQQSELLQEIIKILQNQRSVQANELIRQATSNLVRGFYEEAKDRLLKALAWDNTDFQVHRNLGFVYLHTDNGDKAIEHFYKAQSFAPNKRAQFDACADLARSYYAIGDVNKATEYEGKLITMTHQTLGLANADEIARCWYTLGVYNCLSHRSAPCVSALKTSILLHPRYFALAAIDRDFDIERKNVNALLGNLAEDASNRVSVSYNEFVKERNSIPPSQGDMVRQTMESVDHHAKIAEGRIRNASYSDLLKVDKHYRIMKQIVHLAKEEASCKSALKSMLRELKRDKAKLDDLYDQEEERQASLARIEKIKSANKKIWASLGYTFFVLLCFMGTAAVLGGITFFSGNKMIDMLEGQSTSQSIFWMIASAILAIIWGLTNLALVVASVVMPFAVARALLTNMGKFVSNAGESGKSDHGEAHLLQRYRSIVSQKKRRQNQLQHSIVKLSSQTEQLLKRIAWKDALQ